MSKDTFWTIGYKGHYIHGHYDRDLKREVIEVQLIFSGKVFELYTVRSLQGAKQLITRKLKSKLQELEPAMRCGNSLEFQRRLAWLSEGMLKIHLSNEPCHMSKDQAEIDLYMNYSRNFV